ncbi:hypothetical protein RCH22_002067 [Cryobacterium psychrotolerans]|nr:hypothetical protein [Cryobacterium psychrotolerans]
MSSWPTPAASAASNQRRMPYEVVARRMSGRAAMIARVSLVMRASSAAAAMRMAGAWTTSAPRRSKAAMRSSERRSLVTAMRKPSSWSARNPG